MADAVTQKDRAYDWFLANQTSSLKDVAEEFDIPYETVRDWGKREGWYSRRLRQGPIGELSEDVGDQARDIRLVIYRKIVMEGMGADDLSGMVKAWLSMSSMVSPQKAPETFDQDTILGMIRDAETD